MHAGSRKEPEEVETTPKEEIVPEPEPEIPVEPEPTVEEEVKKPDKPKGAVISGTVIDESGKPVSGVNVFCIDEDGKTVARTVTDKNGVYKFEGLEKGNYAINISHPGFTGPVEISFNKSEPEPPAPSGLVVFETGKKIKNNSYVGAIWNRVPGATGYRCELYVKGNETVLVQYPDIKQDYCEFGNLSENTEYRVLVYSKNESGYSREPASGEIKTMNKPPNPPFGLGVTYAKNYRVDIIWNRGGDDELEGYVIQIKKNKDPYLFYSDQGLTKSLDRAAVIEDNPRGFIQYSIFEVSKDGVPIVDNVTPYSFRVFSLDKFGALSSPSMEVKDIVLEDTVPPNPPSNIKYEFIGNDRLRISWESKDRDIEKYVLSYGVNKDRWDGVVSTKSRSYELIINREQLKDKELYVAVKAVDRGGNESGYKPLVKNTAVTRSGEVIENIVLSSNNIYRDYSVAVKDSGGIKTPPRDVVKKPTYPNKYGFSVLKKKGFVIKRGETAVLNGEINVPVNTLIKVMSGGKLIIEDAEVSALGGTWLGIQYLGGSYGKISHSEITGASVGVDIVNNDTGIVLSNTKITGCFKQGINIKNSRVQLSAMQLRDNLIGVHIEKSKVSITNSIIEKNEKGILARGYSFYISDSQVKSNRVYGLRLYGGGKIEKNAFKHNLAGIVLEDGAGNILMSDNFIEQNSMDGIVVNASQNTEISRNLISTNGRHGIYVKENANPNVFKNDIINNKSYAVTGGGKITNCFIAYNNGSAYIDDTREKGRPDNILSSSSSGVVKQIFNADYINELTFSSSLR
jgi:parallel beta-helix repeat protein